MQPVLSIVQQHKDQLSETFLQYREQILLGAEVHITYKKADIKTWYFRC